VQDKYWFADEARAIREKLGLDLYATSGTAEILASLDIPCIVVGKGEAHEHDLYRLFEDGSIDLVINVPREYDQQGRPDGYRIRRMAIDSGVPLFTDQQLARSLVEALLARTPESLGHKALGEHGGEFPFPGLEIG
jgi:carbamoyl-phosphate synthase large subunit